MAVAVDEEFGSRKGWEGCVSLWAGFSLSTDTVSILSFILSW